MPKKGLTSIKRMIKNEINRQVRLSLPSIAKSAESNILRKIRIGKAEVI